jgi:AraC family transcriptional regulator
MFPGQRFPAQPDLLPATGFPHGLPDFSTLYACLLSILHCATSYFIRLFWAYHPQERASSLPQTLCDSQPNAIRSGNCRCTRDWRAREKGRAAPFLRLQPLPGPPEGLPSLVAVVPLSIPIRFTLPIRLGILPYASMPMENPTQLERYRRTIDYIQKHFTGQIGIPEIEAVSFYSYRNINRVFRALHGETIGKYINRLRLEKAAQILKYSEEQVSNISLQVGYVDVAAFSKAFRKRFGCAPTAFRETVTVWQPRSREPDQAAISDYPPLEFDIVELPAMELFFLEYRGDYADHGAILQTWDRMVDYLVHHELLHEEMIFLGEMLDDEDISDELHCRYHAAVVLPPSLRPAANGHFRTRTTQPGRYVRVFHRGSNHNTEATFSHIYARWMKDVRMEFADRPMLEIYHDPLDEKPEKERVTEICIAVN